MVSNMKLNKRTGWVEGITHCPSEHFNSRPSEEISLLVIHNISLPPKKFGGNYVELFFTDKLPINDDPYFMEIAELKVSSHFFIKRTGDIVQFVSCKDRAWHAGVSSFNGREACNDFSIGIELEGADDIEYTDEQYHSLSDLTKLLMNSYSEINIDRIVGHNQIAPSRKTDPGESFDWTRFKSNI